ncbi:MAG TPA: 4Fe-4S dicluster domain-containing protein [Xanthobacteraceae bacterium]|nr:4Fe-4S dicluster domain-containing protein [Xanthobacteraceae bacterium]
MTRWVMVADLERCVGCQTCTAACRHANATSPAVQWRRVLDVEVGDYPYVSRTFVPVGCQHCADPPCMHVCPSTATRRRPDGIVTIDYDICIGCAYCDVACPYQARFKLDAPRFAYGKSATESELAREQPERMGVAQKCTFCSDRIDFGLANGLVPGQDPRATPACVNACIADALHFGDLDDPNSNVSRLLREQHSFRMHEELGTEPGFYYVYESVRGSDRDPNPHSVLVANTGRAGSIRARGIEPSHQQHWDWKAAGNFACGGLGSGLFLFVAMATLRHQSWYQAGWFALGAVALGLFLVFLKIGRPWRFLYVLRQPQRSWMTREAYVAAVFFPAGIVGTWLENAALMLFAAFVGLLFLFSQAMILYEAKGIPAWRTSFIIPLIIGTGVTEGGGLFLVLNAALQWQGPAVELTAVAVAMLAALRGWIWRSYLTALLIEGAPLRALDALERFRPWFLVLGLIAPLLLIALGLVVTSATMPLFALSGLLIAAAGVALKFVLVTRAGWNQGFALKHTPARGTGAAGPGVKPGWSGP